MVSNLSIVSLISSGIRLDLALELSKFTDILSPITSSSSVPDLYISVLSTKLDLPIFEIFMCKSISSSTLAELLNSKVNLTAPRSNIFLGSSWRVYIPKFRKYSASPTS